METPNNIKKAITDLQTTIASELKKLDALFDEGLVALLNKNKNAVEGYTIESLSVRVSNHEFNDGDRTYFHLNYEDCISLYVVDSKGEEVEISYEEDVEFAEKFTDVIKEFESFFGSFDVGDFFENRFGDSYDSISFSINKDGGLSSS